MAAPVASDESIIVEENSASNIAPTLITDSGTPVTPTAITIASQPSNGTASVVNGVVLYTPTANYFGTDSFTYYGTYGGLDSNTATISVSVLAQDCTDIGRTSRLYVTAYNLNRPAITRARRYAKRCFLWDFNGALDPSALITSARFDCYGPWAGYMSNPRIIYGQRKAAVDVEFNFAGWTGLLCTVTLANGEAYNAEFHLTVTDSPLYPRAQYNTVNGPFVLTTSV